MAEVDLVKAELAANPALYTGLPAHRIVDVMNDPREVGTATTYRAVTAEEVANAAPEGLVKIQKAAGDYEAATNAAELAAALPGATLAARLTVVGNVEVAPGSQGRAMLDAAVPAFLKAAERNAIAALGTVTQPVKATLWQQWGWSHSVTIALVEEAQS